MGENLADPVQVDVNTIYDVVHEIEQHLDNASRWLGLRSPTTATLFRVLGLCHPPLKKSDIRA